MSGRAWKFKDNISTDEISPGRFMSLRSNLPELAKHTLEDARKEFPIEVKEGDFVVAGTNFGMGSSREQISTGYQDVRNKSGSGTIIRSNILQKCD